MGYILSDRINFHKNISNNLQTTSNIRIVERESSFLFSETFSFSSCAYNVGIFWAILSLCSRSSTSRTEDPADERNSKSNDAAGNPSPTQKAPPSANG